MGLLTGVGSPASNRFSSIYKPGSRTPGPLLLDDDNDDDGDTVVVVPLLLSAPVPFPVPFPLIPFPFTAPAPPPTSDLMYLSVLLRYMVTKMARPVTTIATMVDPRIS